MRIAVAGAHGRMGRAMVEIAREAGEEVRPVDRDDRADALAWAQVIIDFSTAASSAELARAAAAAAGPALVIGTTGATADEREAIVKAAGRIPILASGNFSLGVNLMAALARIAADQLGKAWDVDILDTHHRDKRDSPSGTAFMLAEAIGARDHASRLAFHSIRAGDIVGEHKVTFGGTGESLTLSHSARDRSIFARGGLAAARWIIGRPPALYAMADVLGFRSL